MPSRTLGKLRYGGCVIRFYLLSRFFEVQDGMLLFSGDNGIPLVRYHIADTGGKIADDEMLEFLRSHEFDPIATLQQQGARGIHSLPFVYVFGRANFTVGTSETRIRLGLGKLRQLLDSL